MWGCMSDLGRESLGCSSGTLRDAKIKKRVKAERIQMFLAFFVIILVFVLVGFIYFVNKKMEDGRFYRKDLMQQELKLVINNGGGLSVLKHAVSNFPLASEFAVLFSSLDEYYSPRTPLAVILNDLRLEAFKTDDKSIRLLLDALISEYEEVNPFEGLPVGQKDRFENVRVKAGDDYLRISGDVNSIAEELRQKNLLVEDYLSDSKMSFWISIIAVVISLGIGGYQILTARPEAMKRLFSEALAVGGGDRIKNPADE